MPLGGVINYKSLSLISLETRKMSGWPRRTSTSAYLCYERLPIGWRLMKALGDRFHESGGHGTGDWLAGSPFAVDETMTGIIARWQHAVELAMTDEGDWKADGDFRSRTEAASRVAQAKCYSGTLRTIVLRGRTKTGSLSDGTALRRTGADLWPAGGSR